MMTPRFRASSHVIGFVLTEERTAPILVVKLPRLPGDNERLDREVSNLHAANHGRDQDDDSIPRIVAYEDYHEHRLLIETAVPGQPMSPAVVRRQPEACIEAALAWLFALQDANQPAAGWKPNGRSSARHWYERLVEQPFRQFRNILPASAADDRLIEPTVALLEPFRDHNMPLVMEHGDFSSPNILQDERGRVGVVDWELAEPEGLPVSDLFFFLTYVAFARNGARKNSDYLKAFQQAFFGPSAWAWTYVTRYYEKFNLSRELVIPLFVLTWGRYVAGLVMRLQESNENGSLVGNETVKWLKSNRYYVLWRYAVENVKDLRLAS
jgi:aminoglycoside phosphotransferase